MKNEYITFGEGTADEKIIEEIDEWMKSCETYHDQLLRKQNESHNYYLGNQTNRDEVPAYSSDTVFNRIFEATETIIPIITGSAHQFVAMPAEENEISFARSQRVARVLSKKYEDTEVRRKLENVARDIIIKRFGVLEWGWDIDTDDVNCWVRDPRTIYIPKLRVDAHDLPYVIKIAEFDEYEMRRYFPDANVEDMETGRKIQTGTTLDTQDNEVYQVQVVYTPEYFVWRCNDKILKKMPNPYYDFEGTDVAEEETEQYGKIKRRNNRIFQNHLERPTLPFIFFTPFTSGDAPVAEISLCEAAMPIQDDINVSKRQILDNLRRMGNGQVYIDTEAMSREQAEAITNEPGLILMGSNLASENRVRRESATPIPASHFTNLADSINSFDNIFGVHGAVRGASNNETLGGQIMDRQQNLSRIEQLTRELNRGVSRLADAYTQMMKMYYTEEKVFRFLGNDGSVEFLKFISDDVESGIVIETKSGSSPSLDPLTKQNQAIQLWQLQAIDPETLFERLEFPDPQLTAQKLQAWRTGQLMLESQVRQQEAQTKAELGMQAEQAQAAMGGGQEPMRNVEMPESSLQRSQQDVGGGAGMAPLQNTPNM